MSPAGEVASLRAGLLVGWWIRDAEIIENLTIVKFGARRIRKCGGIERFDFTTNI